MPSRFPAPARRVGRSLPVALIAAGLALGAPAQDVPPPATAVTTVTTTTTTAPAPFGAAVADPARPEADRARDANRQPAAVLAFVFGAEGAARGQRVLDYAASGGYFTRLLAAAVGPTGHVYATTPSPLLKFKSTAKSLGELDDYAVAHPNVSVTFGAPMDAARAPGPLDVFFLSQFYHDLHDPFMGPVDVAAFNRAVFAGLKPGGLYVVLDHVAARGAAPDVTDTLHRIEPGVARREIEAAGFVFAGESTVLANPTDPRDKDPFDASIRGRTDQFLMKFQKPLDAAPPARLSEAAR